MTNPKRCKSYNLKQQFKGFSVSNTEGSQGYDRFQILLSQLEIHGAGVSTEDSTSKVPKISYLSAWSQFSLDNEDPNPCNTNEVSTAYSVPNLSGQNSKNGLEVANSMISIDDKFYKKTGRKLQFDAKEPVGFDKTKVECYNCHKTGHFARECRTKGTQDNRRRDAWNSGNKDGNRIGQNEILRHGRQLMEIGEKQNLEDASIEINAYSKVLKKVEAQFVAHQQGQTMKLLKYPMSANDKFGLGYGDHRYDGILSYENEVLQSVFMNKKSEIENQPLYDRFVTAEGMHVVPPPMTGNYMPSGPDVEVDDSKFTYGPKQTQPSESESQSSEFDTCESNISAEPSELVSEPVVNESNVKCQPKVWSDAPIIEEYESDSEDECVSIPTKQQETPSFANKQVKTPRETVKNQYTHSQIPKVDKKELGYGFTVRACFVCGSLNHLIRDCDFHEKRMARKAELNNGWNNVQRVNKQNQFVPSAVLTRTDQRIKLIIMHVNKELTKLQPNMVFTYSSTITPALKSADKKEGPREEEQVFMDELERLKRQEKEANEEAESLRKKFETLVIQDGAAKPSKPKKISEALEDESWVECNARRIVAKFEIHKVLGLRRFPYGKKGYRMPSFMEIDEEVYVSQPPGFLDPKYPQKVYKVVKALYGFTSKLPQSLVSLLYKLSYVEEWATEEKEDGIFISPDKCLQFVLVLECLHLNWKSYQNSDYAGANLDRKSTTGGSFFGCYYWDDKSLSWHWFKVRHMPMLYRYVMRKHVNHRFMSEAQTWSHDLEKTEGECRVSTRSCDILKQSFNSSCSHYHSEAQPTPSPAPTSEVPNEPQTASSPAQTSEVHIEQQTDLSPRPSPTPIIPESVPETSGENLGDQAKEIQLLKAQITKLKKQAKLVIKHHRAWLKSVSLKQRLPSKSFSKKHKVHKESVSKQGRKVAKGESSVQRDPLFDTIPEDSVDHMETENAQDEGRTREMVDEDKEMDEIRLSTEDVLSTDKEVVSTDKEVVSTDKEKVSTDRPIVSIDGSKISTDRQIEGIDEQVEGTNEHIKGTEEHNEGAEEQIEGAEEQIEGTDGQRKGTEDQTEEEIAAQATQTPTQTHTSTVFGDDETIAKVLLNMSQAKAVSREKEKGEVGKILKEPDRPRTYLYKINPDTKALPKMILKR
ncbi:putative ribonuclease H-like domain-containing protein [Tanacetum coccineum]